MPKESGATTSKSLGFVGLILLAVLVGAAAGLGAIVFRGLIALFHNLLFLGEFSLTYDASAHTPASPWGVLVVLVPVLGAVGVAFLVKNFAPEAMGTGVPEVIDAIYYRQGKIRPALAVVKSLASSLSIGSGAPVGREGPVIQIGSAFGSLVGQIMPMNVRERITLIAAGAGGGIAATFNTPLGGILFAFEVMMHEVSVRTIVPIALSSITATYLARLVFGAKLSFIVPQFQVLTFQVEDLGTMLFYAVLGVILGLIAAGFTQSVYGLQDFFEKRIRGSYYLRHMAAMLLVGIAMLLLMLTTGHYYIEGVGYAAIQDLLSSTSPALSLLLLLFAVKWLATSLSLGSGASGGIFSPTLYMGAMLGGAYGVILHRLFPGLVADPVPFAVAGMAGLVGGVTGAALASIVMLFEMTFDYSVIVPVTATVALSYAVRKLLMAESIYTLKLVRRGHNVPEAMQANLHFLTQAKQMMDEHFRTVPAQTTLADFVADTLPDHSAIANYLVELDGQMAGVISRRDALATAVQSAAENRTLGELASKAYVIVQESTTLLEVIARMRDRRAAVAMVATSEEAVSVDCVEGLITKERLTDFVGEAAEWFQD